MISTTIITAIAIATGTTIIGVIDLIIGDAINNRLVIKEGCYLMAFAFGMWIGLLAYLLSSLYFH